MSYPPYVPTRAVSVGGAMSLEGAESLRLRVTVASSRSLVWDETGFRFDSMPTTVTSEPGGEALLLLPRTDSPGWRDGRTGGVIDVSAPDSHTHTYRAVVSFLTAEGGTAPITPLTIGPFVLPEGDGPIDLDKTVPVGTVSGQVLSVPDTWSALVEAAEAAAAEAAASLAQIGTPDVEASADSIPKRTSTGALSVGAPTADEHAVPLGALADPDSQARAALGATYAPAAQDFASTGIEYTRSPSNPMLTVAAQNPAPGAAAPATAESLCWPWVVDARAALGSAALDEFYLYYSTDHAAVHENSGIWLATGPTPTGPWTGRGRVFIDMHSGAQTECPTVVWNDVESLFFMYYQQQAPAGALGEQCSMLATSPNGVAWTRVGIAVDVKPGMVTPGNGHTGYFHVTRLGRQWYAHHLLAAGDNPYFALSTSHDGRTWVTDPRVLSYGRDQTLDGRRIEWNNGDVVEWKGRLWWVGFFSDFVSGAAAKDARLGYAPLADDLRHILGPPTYVLYPTVGAHENTNYRSVQSFVDRGGRLHLIYQCGDTFNAAIAH